MRNYKKYMRFINGGIDVKTFDWNGVDEPNGTKTISGFFKAEGEYFYIKSYEYYVKNEIHCKTEIYNAMKDTNGKTVPIAKSRFFNRAAMPTSAEHIHAVIERFVRNVIAAA